MSTDISDPITGETFYDPVLASDGFIYNYDTLVEIVNSSGTRLSPFTNQPLRKVAYTHNHMREILGIPTENENKIVRMIYNDISIGDNGIVKMTMDLNIKKFVEDPWVELLLKDLNLWDQELFTLTFFVTKPLMCDEKCLWNVYGPPPIEQLKDKILRFAKCFSLTSMYNQCENLGNAIITIKGKRYSTLEILVGCERSQFIYESLMDS
jgi:hypothetical protein